ncbi:MAG: helix-turn-helix transcriptional regulator [Clostridia bacterium]|nr:helix-turn-helix transcriptional regulator [Clostridia bacterium]
MFGKRLKEARNAKGFTLEELAVRYNSAFDGGLNKGTLSKYENGKQEPAASTVSNLSTILGVSVDYLMGNSDSPVPVSDADEGRPFLIINNRNGKPIKIFLTNEQLDRAQKALELIIPDAVEDIFD